MSLKIAIVGLPNVGKSTLFNALTKSLAAEAQNYPFCTIDPNIGIVEVPDHRLDELAKTADSQKLIPAVVEFVDIAGLVKGASTGEGLGNKFLANIRECDAIGHVVRIFDDKNITHVHGNVNPKFDREVIESELLLADVQTLEKRLQKALSDAKSGESEKKKYAQLLEMVMSKFNEGVLASNIGLTDEEKLLLSDLHLLTMKQHLYFINLHEQQIQNLDIADIASRLGVPDQGKIIPICAKIEEELGTMSEEDAQEYLDSFGLKETGLNALIKAAYKTLGLITYFTCGPKEAHAWTIKNGTLAPQAAGVIHTDFEKGFIKAEVIFWQDFVSCGGEVKAKEKGLMRMEGKEYIVRDGDVMLFKFSS
ncbi:redox-regulated ATPase YchF [Candidatus Peregrinibacteria bacterium]|nr:redox-regulated ATPase YchF [Candidatus Peregrinibacteria bacterium]